MGTHPGAGDPDGVHGPGGAAGRRTLLPVQARNRAEPRHRHRSRAGPWSRDGGGGGARDAALLTLKRGEGGGK